MTDRFATAYERDMSEEAVGLLRFAEAPLSADLSRLDLHGYERIVLSGMGGSDCAMIPFELALARAGLPAWRIPAGRLLETPELITPGSLLVIASQSGRSGEVVALIERSRGRPRTIVGVTNDADSPLAVAADHVVLLHSGAEATVATKSYANTLAAFHRVAGAVLGRPDGAAVDDIRAAAASLQARIDEGDPAVERVAPRLRAGPSPRLVLLGSGPDAATTLAGALVLKEAAKVPAEGYVAGAFRHGPLELAGPGLAALMFGTGSPHDLSAHALARDIAATGGTVVTVAPEAYAGSDHIPVPGATDLERLVHGMYVVQRLSVELARAAGIVPGAFLYGRKITDQL